MGRQFLGASFIVLAAVLFIGRFWPPILLILLILVPVIAIGLLDYLQTRQGVRRNFPVIGNLRYFFEAIRPELQQYFVEDNLNGRPVSREFRSVVYQRAKGAVQTLPFGTQRDVYAENHEWVNHSILPLEKSEPERVKIGGKDCSQPYEAALMNVAAMSYGALSSAAISALNLGAKEGGFFHNTGEGGISPYHLLGGDLVWQIGTGYFGCRTKDGRFDPEAFKDRSNLEQVKMVEIKLSQGAKPGKGGLLPGKKVTQEVAHIRMVEVGQDVLSPSKHSAFETPEGLLLFIKQLRELSGGKPVGFKLCIGKKSEFIAICRAMLKLDIRPDYITIDGAEGGTGAAPLEFSNSIGTPLEEALAFTHDTLRGFGLRDEIRLIAAGKVFTSFHMLTRIALGADIINSARGMMLSMGCIQALKCNTNKCPVGVATTDPRLVRGLHVPTKSHRVARFQKETVKAFYEILNAMGYKSASELKRSDVYRRIFNGEVRTYEELFPSVEEGAYLGGETLPTMNHELLRALNSAQAESF